MAERRTRLTLFGLQHFRVQTDEDEKQKTVVDLVDALEFNRAIVFVRSTARAEELAALLTANVFPATCISSDGLGQNEGSSFQWRIAVSSFNDAADLVERAEVVIFCDLPDSPEEYLLCCGREGAFGIRGLVLSFVSSAADSRLIDTIQSRFSVEIPAFPGEVDPASYMPCGGSLQL